MNQKFYFVPIFSFLVGAFLIQNDNLVGASFFLFLVMLSIDIWIHIGKDKKKVKAEDVSQTAEKIKMSDYFDKKAEDQNSGKTEAEMEEERKTAEFIKDAEPKLRKLFYSLWMEPMDKEKLLKIRGEINSIRESYAEIKLTSFMDVNKLLFSLVSEKFRLTNKMTEIKYSYAQNYAIEEGLYKQVERLKRELKHLNQEYRTGIHILKTVSPHFQNIVNGIKTFEVRKDDRDFQVNDVLILNEYSPSECYAGSGQVPELRYTGKKCFVVVKHILRDTEYNLPGFVTMSISLIDPYKK